MVAPAAHPVWQGRHLRKIPQLFRRGLDTDVDDSGRRGDRVGADGAWRRVGLAHGAAARYRREGAFAKKGNAACAGDIRERRAGTARSEEHTSELQSLTNL